MLRAFPAMNTKPTLLAKSLVAAFSFALMAAVPLLTVQYAVAAHAETKAPEAAKAPCPRTCPAGEKKACTKESGSCSQQGSCKAENCGKK